MNQPIYQVGKTDSPVFDALSPTVGRYGGFESKYSVARYRYELWSRS